MDWYFFASYFCLHRCYVSSYLNPMSLSIYEVLRLRAPFSLTVQGTYNSVVPPPKTRCPFLCHGAEYASSNNVYHESGTRSFYHTSGILFSPSVFFYARSCFQSGRARVRWKWGVSSWWLTYWGPMVHALWNFMCATYWYGSLPLTVFLMSCVDPSS